MEATCELQGVSVGGPNKLSSSGLFVHPWQCRRCSEPSISTVLVLDRDHNTQQHSHMLVPHRDVLVVRSYLAGGTEALWASLRELSNVTQGSAVTWWDKSSMLLLRASWQLRRDVNQGKRPDPAQPHVHYLLPTHDAQPPAGERLLSNKHITAFHPVPNLNPLRRFATVALLGYLEEECFSVFPNGTRQAFLLIAEMLASERMSLCGSVPSAYAAFKCQGCNMSRHRTVYDLRELR